MSEQGDGSGWKSSTRGEQAWKEAMDDVASRNAAARRAGKREREEYEQGRADMLRAGAEKRRSELLRRRTP